MRELILKNIFKKNLTKESIYRFGELVIIITYRLQINKILTTNINCYCLIANFFNICEIIKVSNVFYAF